MSAPEIQSVVVRLKERREVAEHTWAFRFEKPAGFAFKAGQYMDITLIHPPETDEEGDTRSFSIASGPHEDTLMIATRHRDTAFKRVLTAIPLNSEAKVEGPFGNLTLHNNVTRPAILLAGGIGITPFRSMVFRAAHEKLAQRIYLFYSNRRLEDAPFLEELRALEGDNPNYKFIGTMTAVDKARSSWKGESGYIDMEMISRHAKEATSPVFYIAGPPAMVTGLQKMLNKAGVDDDDIRTEEFSGY